MKIETHRLYENRDDVTLTAYILDDSPELAAGKRRPAIIVNPGGAYVMLSDREAEPIAMRFAGMGFHTFVLRYSVFTGGTNVWPENLKNLPPDKKEVQYPAPLIELGMSMLTVKKHADEWCIDREQIGICGFSAGGHNCTMYASSWFRSILTESLHTTEAQLRPAFCIVGYPFVDWEFQYNLEMDELTRDSYRWMYQDYYGETDPPAEKMRACSPNYMITRKTAPTFIWTTATDKSVDPRHSIRLVEAMADHGVPYEFHIFSEGAHGLALADRATFQKSGDINETVAQWVPLADMWLKNILKLETNN